MILKAAYSYSALCNYRFLFGMGSRKGIFRSTMVSFPEAAFHHLAGFQYVSRNPKFVSRKRALYNVKARIITEEDFVFLENLEQVRNKWSTIRLIEQALRNSRYIMEYTQSKGPRGSKIRAKYVIPFFFNEDTHYFFFDGKSDGEMVPVSCLVDNHWKYELGCTKWTVLKIEKIHSGIDQVEVVFCHEGFKQDHDGT